METTGTAPATTPTTLTATAHTIPTTPIAGAQSVDVKAAAQEAIRKLKYKNDDGTDGEVDEAEALKVYRERKQHQAVSSRELNKARLETKKNEEIAAMFKDEGKVEHVLRKLGHDPRKLAEKILGAQLEDEMMDPKDRELKKLRQKLEERERVEKENEESIKTKRLDELKDKYRKEYEVDFVKALEKSQLPATKEVVGKMAAYVARCAKLGYQISTDEAAELVKQDIQNFHKNVVGNADGEILLKLLGDEVANKIRKYDTGKLKNPTADLTTPENQEQRERRSATKKRMTTREWQLHKRGLK